MIAESPEVGEKLDEVRSAGYSVYLLLDCKRRIEERARPRSRPQPGTAPAATEPRLPSSPVEPGVFRINAGDLAFLRALGIDPTRRLRRRPSRPASEEDEGPAGAES
ncbi:MAG TPA: hypothetical protein VMV46_18715 [Thermoanaerobaculia bacterium]|nr:hypothetical protein [Thermoanaerobaculia bacterium]